MIDHKIFIYTLLLTSYITSTYAIKDDDIELVEINDNIIINYQPTIHEDDRNDDETLEDNICMEIEVIDHETNVKADDSIIKFITGNELCWDIGEPYDKQKTIIVRPVGENAIDKTYDVKINGINHNFVKDLETDDGPTNKQQKNIYNLASTNKLLMGDETGKYLMSFKVHKKTYRIVPDE